MVTRMWFSRSVDDKPALTLFENGEARVYEITDEVFETWVSDAEATETSAKKEMAKALPVIIDLLKNLTFVEAAIEAGYQFDSAAFIKDFTESSGWKSSVCVLRKAKP